MPRLGLVLTTTGTTACLALTIVVPPAPRLVWNASASAPIGLYGVHAAVLQRGDMVIAQLPAHVRLLAAQRHYLPLDVPVVKRVAAIAGDTICADAAIVRVNGAPVATRLPTDRRGRVLPWWNGCTTLTAGAVFLLIRDVPASFDGRYFGPTSADDIVGKAKLVWAR